MSKSLSADVCFCLGKRGGRRTRNSLWRELLLLLVGLEVDESREQQDHVAALVHDWCVAVGAGDLAGEFVAGGLLAAVI